MYPRFIFLIAIALCAIIFWVKQLLNLLDVIDRWKKHKRKHYCKDCYHHMSSPRYDSPGRCSYFRGSPAFEGKHECECFIEKKRSD